MKVEIRECSKCNETKPVSLFRKTGKRCSACCREYEAEYRENNREQIDANYARWRRRKRVCENFKNILRLMNGPNKLVEIRDQLRADTVSESK